MAGSTRDITEQNQAAQQIEDDRRRWRELAGANPAAIAVLRGPEHTFQWVNPDYARLVGRPAESSSEKPCMRPSRKWRGRSMSICSTAFTAPESLSSGMKCRSVWTGATAFKDLYLNFVYAATRDVDGEIDGVFAHVTDVTDMVVARKHIEESERQFRTLAETIPHLAWMADEKGDRFWYNRRWYDYTGTTLEEMRDGAGRKFTTPTCCPRC